MSRIIVKQLPKDIKPETLQEYFSQRGGQITDVALKRNRETGEFRGFAFLGFKSPEQAKDAIEYFNNTYIGSNKIVVEECAPLQSRPPPMKKKFEKVFKDVLAKKKKAAEEIDGDKKPAKRPKLDPFEEVKDDPQFKEFLDAQRNIEKKPSKKYIWADDVLPDIEPDKKKSQPQPQKKSASKKKQKEGDTDTIDDPSEKKSGDAFKDGAWGVVFQGKKSSQKPTKGDQNALKSSKKSEKQSDKPLFVIDTEGKTEKKLRKRRPKKKKNLAHIVDDKKGSDDSDEEKTTNDKKENDAQDDDTPFKMPKKIFDNTVKIRGLPLRTKKSDIKKLFKPSKLLSIRKAKGVKSLAYVSFSTPNEMKAALRKNGSIFNGHQLEIIAVDVVKVKDQLKSQIEVKKQRYKEEEQRKKALIEEAESVAETGRLFVRNLPYSCTQEDLEKHFSQYGTITEVHLSIDEYTKKPKGFAFVTFMFPEHAVKAYNELDGTDFQGRVMHLIAAKAPPEKKARLFDEDGEGGGGTSSYKKQKKEDQKKEAQSSHNWNSLFLNANAVADIIAEKFNVKKSQLLTESSTNDSIATRMALAETQLVNETKQFLIDNGVELDAFANPAAPRSKTVMLIKNLPKAADKNELFEMFSKYGLVTKIVLPPTVGLTALVEMQEPTEAKIAFRNLAYKNYHHIPLYLEWAPVNVFKHSSTHTESSQTAATEDVGESQVKEEVTEDSTATATANQDTSHQAQDKDETTSKQVETQEQGEEEDEEVPEEGAVLFVKNLNFSTTEEQLKKHFSQCGRVCQVTIAKKMVKSKEEGTVVPLSQGFGFVQFYERHAANKALKELQNSQLDDHTIELKRSDKKLSTSEGSNKKKRKSNNADGAAQQTGTKIVVRNVPFEATERELRKLFEAFGGLKFVRMPKKLTGGHRGFAFVDFMSKKEAKHAFDALCQSTHLYGRRLVLEWAKPDPFAEEQDESRGAGAGAGFGCDSGFAKKYRN